MFASSFTVTLASYILLRALAAQRAGKIEIPWVAIGANALAYCILLRLVNWVDQPRLISCAFVALGVCCCLVSVALTASAGTSFEAAVDVALVLAHSTCKVAVAFNFVYVVELFPTPVRCSAACLSFACARFGGVFGAVLSALRRVGREDLSFALTTALLFVSASLFNRLLPVYGTFAPLAGYAEQSGTPVQTSEI